MYLRKSGLLVFVSVGGLAFGTLPAFGSGFSDGNSRIAFVSDRDGGDLDIWTMRPNGSQQVNLTADSDAEDVTPSWRPDGRKVAFMSDRVTAANPEADFEIFVMNADGSALRQVTSNALDDEVPSWSPDGRKIVFQRDFDPVRGQVDYDLLTMRADGTRERNLTNSPGILETDADWSPNGRRIAFVSDRDGDGEIYTMAPDGSRVRQLTFNDGPFDSALSWSPDGSKIAFDTDRHATEETPFQVEIYTMRANGADQTRLTFDVLTDNFPTWSPDGAKIAFTSFRLAPDENDNVEIFTMRADGSNQVNQTRNPAFDLDPDWQAVQDGHR